MRYYFEGFIIGLCMFWFIGSLSIINHDMNYNNPWLAVVLPFCFWAVWSLFQFAEEGSRE